jgi:hypothetical protein
MKAETRLRPSSRAAAKSPPTCQDLDAAAASSDPIPLRRRLEAFQKGALRTESVRVDLPVEGAIRMRSLVHRGTQRPVFKVPSLKLGRIVQCESILEQEAAVLMDVCSSVHSFCEQPVRIHYCMDGELRSHIPDFVAVTGGTLTFIEIKFRDDIDDAVLARTSQMKSDLRILGAKYVLLSEVDIRRGETLQSALGVLRRARQDACPARKVRIAESLLASGGLPLNQFGWNEAGSTDAVCIAQLIRDGFVNCDAFEGLTDATLVWTNGTTSAKESTSWLPALSA